MDFVGGDFSIRKDEGGNGGNLNVEGVITTEDIFGLRENHTITGDGVTNNFFISHTLGIKDVQTSLLNEEGVLCLASITATSIGNLVVAFSNPPANGEKYTIIITK